MSLAHACPLCRALHRRPGRCVFDGAALEPATRDPWRGLLLGGRYRIGAPIADGRRARIYRGRCPRADRAVAIKLLYAERAVDAAEATRLVREHELASRVRHPHVLEVIETSAAGPLPYLVTELAEGPSLADALAEEPPAPERALRLFRQLCAGVDALHQAGVVHRDLRPERVLLSREGDGERALVCGLSGGSRRCRRGVSHTRPIPVRDPAAATPAPAPAATRDAERADLVALGAILDALLEPSSRPRASDVAVARLAAVRQRLRAPGAASGYASAGAILADLSTTDGLGG